MAVCHRQAAHCNAEQLCADSNADAAGICKKNSIRTIRVRAEVARNIRSAAEEDNPAGNFTVIPELKVPIDRCGAAALMSEQRTLYWSDLSFDAVSPEIPYKLNIRQFVCTILSINKSRV